MRKFSLIFLAYSLATAVAALVYTITPASALWKVLYADIAATLVIFGFSFCFRNSSFYDAYWSVAPIYIAITLMFTGSSGNLTREVLVLALIALWGIRLTLNWAQGWQGIAHEDWRYRQLQEQTGMFYWPISLLGIHLLPTGLVFLGCVPLFAVFSTHSPLNWLDLIASVVTLSAIALEAEADRQLHRFRATRNGPEEILDSGVWAWCRHPNYLGEIGFWIGLFIFGYATLGGATDLMKIGPVSMVLLFMIISIPMIDKRLIENKPGYEAFKRRSFALLPFSTFFR